MYNRGNSDGGYPRFGVVGGRLCFGDTMYDILTLVIPIKAKQDPAGEAISTRIFSKDARASERRRQLICGKQLS